MDLNIVVDACGVRSENVLETVKKAYQLGYHTVALNTLVDSSNLEGKNIKIPEPLRVANLEGSVDGVRILNRLTGVVKDTGQYHHLLQNPITRKYDIVAVQPVGEKMVQHVCSNPEVEIIALDLSSRLPYPLKRTYLRQASEKGVLFEIQYAPCLRDQTSRRNVIANSIMLGDISKGKNVLISSGAVGLMELRGVDDVVNLATLFGFGKHSKTTVSTNGQKVLLHSFTRRQTGCGFTSVQDASKVDSWILNACQVPRKNA